MFRLVHLGNPPNPEIVGARYSPVADEEQQRYPAGVEGNRNGRWEGANRGDNDVQLNVKREGRGGGKGGKKVICSYQSHILNVAEP